MRPAIYYLCTSPPVAGGELVNFQHVAALRNAGVRAFALLNQTELPPPANEQPAVPMIHWSRTFHFTPDDYLVVPEVFFPNSLELIASLQCKKVMHNQNPYLTRQGFKNTSAINSFGYSAILCGSINTRQSLMRWGVDIPSFFIRPFLLPIFKAENSKNVCIAYIPRKRPDDAEIVQWIFHSLFPQFRAVPWLAIENMGRKDYAKLLGKSQVFASFSKLEGLGLPPLEAMASGCIVCGFDGRGGLEYATPDNGIWIPEGDHEAFARGLATCLTMRTEDQASRLDCGAATSAEFSEQRFASELLRAWGEIIGEQMADYRIDD